MLCYVMLAHMLAHSYVTDESLSAYTAPQHCIAYRLQID